MVKTMVATDALLRIFFIGMNVKTAEVAGGYAEVTGGKLSMLCEILRVLCG